MKKSHLKIGLPLLTTIIIGSFGLQFMYQSKYDYDEQKKEHVEIINIVGKKETLEVGGKGKVWY